MHITARSCTEGSSLLLDVYVEVLEQLGIEWYILADLDFILRGLERFVDKMDREILDDLATLKKTLARQRNHPKGGDIRDTLHPQNRNWVAIYAGVDAAIKALTNGQPLADEQRKRIASLWSSLRDHVHKVSILETVDEAGLQQLLDRITRKIREKGFSVHRHGELEEGAAKSTPYAREG